MAKGANRSPGYCDRLRMSLDGRAVGTVRNEHCFMKTSSPTHHALLATVIVPLSMLFVAAPTRGQSPSLGSGNAFAVLAASTVTSTGNSVVAGDVGVAPGTAITGFPPATATGSLHMGDPIAV